MGLHIEYEGPVEEEDEEEESEESGDDLFSSRELAELGDRFGLTKRLRENLIKRTRKENSVDDLNQVTVDWYEAYGDIFMQMIKNNPEILDRFARDEEGTIKEMEERLYS